MSFRTIVINNRCKLEYSLNYLIIRKLEEEKKVLLDEVRLIIVHSLQVSITSALISEISKRKIKIVFCDEKHQPECEMVSYQNNHYSYRKIKEQINFSNENKDLLWKYIIKEKILNQARNLRYASLENSYISLMKYFDEVEFGDISNREGHSAKVYFNSIFGKDFTRDLDCSINRYLNYGYSILLSCINRSVKSLGYLTELGIHHIGESNPFNLSCDLIEPLRPLVDFQVIQGNLTEENYRKELISLLSKKVKYNNKDFFLDNAIQLYIEDMFVYLKSGDLRKISFIEYEL